MEKHIDGSEYLFFELEFFLKVGITVKNVEGEGCAVVGHHQSQIQPIQIQFKTSISIWINWHPINQSTSDTVCSEVQKSPLSWKLGDVKPLQTCISEKSK